MVKGTTAGFFCARVRFETRSPARPDRAPRILTRLRGFAKLTQHGVRCSLKGDVSISNFFLHSTPLSARSELFELRMRIEYQDRPWKAAGHAGTMRMHP